MKVCMDKKPNVKPGDFKVTHTAILPLFPNPSQEANFLKGGNTWDSSKLSQIKIHLVDVDFGQAENYDGPRHGLWMLNKLTGGLRRLAPGVDCVAQPIHRGGANTIEFKFVGDKYALNNMESAVNDVWLFASSHGGGSMSALIVRENLNAFEDGIIPYDNICYQANRGRFYRRDFVNVDMENSHHNRTVPVIASTMLGLENVLPEGIYITDAEGKLHRALPFIDFDLSFGEAGKLQIHMSGHLSQMLADRLSVNMESRSQELQDLLIVSDFQRSDSVSDAAALLRVSKYRDVGEMFQLRKITRAGAIDILKNWTVANSCANLDEYVRKNSLQATMADFPHML